MSKTVGVALGGGGAKGLAHVAVLQTLEDMGVPVHAVAGTSIGAIIGAGYASGKSADELRASLDELLTLPRSLEEVLESSQRFGWLELLGFDIGKSHILEASAFITEMHTYIGVEFPCD